MATEAKNVSPVSISTLASRLRAMLAHEGRMEGAPEPGRAPRATRDSALVLRSQPGRIRPGAGELVRFKGNIYGDGDVGIDSVFEGSINVPDSTVTVLSSGIVQGCVMARNVIVGGRVNGDITVRERIELKASARVDGDIEARRIAIRDGARITGRVQSAEADSCV